MLATDISFLDRLQIQFFSRNIPKLWDRICSCEHKIKESASQNQITEEEAVEKFIEISKEPNLLRRIGFGKHRGTSFDDLRNNHFDYLEWMKNKMEDKSEDLVFTLDYHLAKGATVSDDPF